jgi:hypothetical protein
MHRYVVVLGAESDARFRDEAVPFTATSVTTPVGNADFIFRTRYASEGYEATVPREMWIDARGETDDELPLAEVIKAYANAAAGFLPMIALSTNVWVGDIAPKVAYDATPGLTERDHFQSFVREESRTLPPTRRMVNTKATDAMLRAIASSAERERLQRAAGQYALALDHWVPGKETMALAHLFIGMEALTPVALRRELERTGLTQDGLAQSWGIEERRTALRRTKLAAEIRRRILFHGDEDTATKARKASDGLEHSFLDFAKVRELAEEVVATTGRYLREAIFEFSDLNESTRSVLSSAPFDRPLRSYYARYLWGQLVGEGDELAAPDQEYPILEWRSRLKSFAKGKDDPDRFVFEPEESMTVRTAAGIGFRRRRWELWGSPASGALPGGGDESTPAVVETDGEDTS